MSRIFISYRREDSSGYAGRLYDQLEEEFGPDTVFMDVDALDPGVDFAERIVLAVEDADVLLAVIGRTWVTSTDAHGRRRLDDPNDFVRVEVGAALRRNITVIPVLVNGATMPNADDLPTDLAGLLRRNALVLSDLDWRSGMNRLAAALRRTLASPDPVKPDPQPGGDDRTPERLGLLAAGAGLAGLALLLLGTLLRWNLLVHPDFGGGDVAHLGIFTSLAPFGVAAGAALALLKALREGPTPLATGLLLGFAFGGAVKYAASLGPSERTGSTASLVLAFAGSLILLALAAVWLVTKHRQHVRSYPFGIRTLAYAGAAMVFAATFVTYNVTYPHGAHREQVVARHGFWSAFEPVAIAIAVAVVAAAARAVHRLAAGGLLVALGFVAALYWARYVGIPALQMAEHSNLASIRAGGIVGVAGGLLVLKAGRVVRDRELERSVDPSSVPVLQ